MVRRAPGCSQPRPEPHQAPAALDAQAPARPSGPQVGAERHGQPPPSSCGPAALARRAGHIHPRHGQGVTHTAA